MEDLNTTDLQFFFKCYYSIKGIILIKVFTILSTNIYLFNSGNSILLANIILRIDMLGNFFESIIEHFSPMNLKMSSK